MEDTGRTNGIQGIGLISGIQGIGWISSKRLGQSGRS